MQPFTLSKFKCCSCFTWQNYQGHFKAVLYIKTKSCQPQYAALINIVHGFICDTSHTDTFVCIPDSKVHGANMGPTWVLSPQMGPMFSPWTLISGIAFSSCITVLMTINIMKLVMPCRKNMCFVLNYFIIQIHHNKNEKIKLWSV